MALWLTSSRAAIFALHLAAGAAATVIGLMGRRREPAPPYLASWRSERRGGGLLVVAFPRIADRRQRRQPPPGIRRDMAVVSVSSTRHRACVRHRDQPVLRSVPSEMQRLPVGQVYLPGRTRTTTSCRSWRARRGRLRLLRPGGWLVVQGSGQLTASWGDERSDPRRRCRARHVPRVGALRASSADAGCAYAFWMLAGAAAAFAPRPAARRGPAPSPSPRARCCWSRHPFGPAPPSAPRTSTISGTGSRSGSPKKMGSVTGSLAAQRRSSSRVMRRSFACRSAPPAIRRRRCR
jgi:hypothetical protein